MGREREFQKEGSECQVGERQAEEERSSGGGLHCGWSGQAEGRSWDPQDGARPRGGEAQ